MDISCDDMPNVGFILLGILAATLGLAAGRSQRQPAKQAGKPRFTGTRKSELATFVVRDGRVLQPTPMQLTDLVSKKMQRPIGAIAVAIATMLASESASGSDTVKAAIAHSAINYAKKKGLSVFALITNNGKDFGAQGIAGHGYAATARPPTIRDILIAEKVLLGRIKDPTGGAVQWDSPAAQDNLVKEKAAGYDKTAAQVAQARQAEGKQAFYLPGVSPNYIRFWRYA